MRPIRDPNSKPRATQLWRSCTVPPATRGSGTARTDDPAGRRAAHDRRGDRRDRPRKRGDGAPLAQALPRRRGRGVARYAASGRTAQGDARVPRAVGSCGPPSAEKPGAPVNSLWTLRRLADYMAEQTGIRVEYETVRLHLKAAGIVLSRPQHTITSPDPEYAIKKRRSKRPATTSSRRRRLLLC